MTSSISTAAAATHAATTNNSMTRWNSPIPYLFGGLAIMLGLVAIALIILACSYRKSSSNSSGNNDSGRDDHEGKPSNTFVHVLQPEMEPKIVIAIMPGDVTPTYLATVSNFRPASHLEEV